jgi:YHS domain-containing protein
VLPIIAIYRKYYGTRFAARITALLFLAMAATALIVEAVFDWLGLVPTSRPDRAQVFGSVGLDYKLVLNVLGLIVFAALFGLAMRRGAKDPTCGMTVDRAQALRLDERRHIHYFCSVECRDRFRVSRT